MSSRFLQRFGQIAQRFPSRVAYRTSRDEGEGGITYGQLDAYSDALANWIDARAPKGKPVVAYGHKSPLMLVSFLAAVKSGRGYSPIDVAYPADRVNDILSQIGSPLVISVADEAFPGDSQLAVEVCGGEEVRAHCLSGEPLRCRPVGGDDVFYLLFTSGSTGRPKGVQMPSRAVDSFMDYFGKFFDDGGEAVSFNRVPFTFDVSLFDLVGGLASGCTLFALEAEAEQSMRALFDAFASSGMAIWISTPSFVEMCLADPLFCDELLPKLQTMILCGEVLRNSTALKLLERFPDLQLYNTYGPTETQAVSDILVDEALATQVNPLPVGFLNPDMHAVIVDLKDGKELPCGEAGEIYLEGSTVSLGYYGRPDLTEAAFTSVRDGSRSLRRYRTGDRGYLDAEGRLFCLGRLDFQVKLNGFRVELGEVEQALANLEQVAEAVVLPVEKDGRVVHLAAFVLLSDPSISRSYATTKELKEGLRTNLPAYMIPRRFVYVDEMPANANGKIDRKALKALLSVEKEGGK